MPKIVDRTEHRELILARSYELFAREGYSAVTLRRLAKELGISTGAIYHYFSSKEEIFEETVAYIARQELMLAVAEVTSKRTRRERLESLTKFLLEHDEQLRLLLLLVLDLYRHNPNLLQSATIERALDTYVEAIVVNLPDIPEDGAHFALDMLLGAIVRRLIVRREDDFRAHIQWLAGLVNELAQQDEPDPDA